MRCWTLAVFCLLATDGLVAQQSPQHRLERVQLDSGTIVRLHWNDGSEPARLLAPIGPDSSMVRYCRYPSPVCGGSTLNPLRARSVRDLTGLEVRRGSRAGHGALIGAGIGTVGGLLILLGQSLSDRPAISTGEQILTVVAIAVSWAGLGALVGAASDNWASVP
jgi:hypothetical protein